jgi:hypothetical protein
VGAAQDPRQVASMRAAGERGLETPAPVEPGPAHVVGVDEIPCVIFRSYCRDPDAPPVFASVSEKARDLLDSPLLFDRIARKDAARLRASMRRAFVTDGHCREQFRLGVGNGERWFEANVHSARRLLFSPLGALAALRERSAQRHDGRL